MCVAWCHDAFGHDITHVYLPSRIYTHDMTHSCIRFDSDWGLHTWQDSLMCVAWWHDALGHEPTHVYLPSRICTRAMTHSYTCHDSFIPVIRLIHTCEWLVHTCEWLIHTRDMTHSCIRCNSDWKLHMWQDSLMYVAWSHDACGTWHNKCILDITHLYTCHDAFIHVPWLIHTRAMTHSYMWMTHSYTWHDSFIRMTW